MEVLRQPLEDGVVTLCRAQSRVTFPARPVLVAAVNPCPCGFYGDTQRRCTCSAERVKNYRSRLSGPLLDRIDLQVALPPVDVAHLAGKDRGEPSAEVRKRVIAARAIQTGRRDAGETSVGTNAELGPRDLEQIATPERAAITMLSQAVERLGLSARAYGKVLRVARTIADLEGSSGVRLIHVAEAVSTRLSGPAGGMGLTKYASSTA